MKKSREEIARIIKKIIIEVLRYNEETHGEIGDDTLLINLGVGSIQILEIVMGIEQEFNIDMISNEELDRLVIFGSCVELVCARLAEQ